MDSGSRNVVKTAGNIVYDYAWEDLLRQNGLLDFDRVMDMEEEEVVKHAVAQRKTARVLLRDGEEVLQAYLKRHYPPGFIKRVGQLLRLSRPKTAVHEFESIVAFRDNGIPTMTPIAAGLQRRGLLQTRSFLITKALSGCVRLDHLLADPRALSGTQKRTLIGQVADLVRNMHERGFNHRDLYLCHILRNTMGGLYLVDLHRVDRRKQVPERWIIKDLAALNYSAPTNTMRRTDRLYFLKCYLGTERLSAPDKLFALKILKKTKKMIQHNEKRKS